MRQNICQIYKQSNPHLSLLYTVYKQMEKREQSRNSYKASRCANIFFVKFINKLSSFGELFFFLSRVPIVFGDPIEIVESSTIYLDRWEQLGARNL
jgi:hypothetical protein